MPDENMQQDGAGEPALEQVKELNLALQQDNFTLRNWVVGLLQGCEGCTDQAIKWAEAMDLTQAHPESTGTEG